MRPAPLALYTRGGMREMGMTETMVDVQGGYDDRETPIDQAGVSDLRYPIVVLDRQRERQQTIARVSMSVNLPHHF